MISSHRHCLTRHAFTHTAIYSRSTPLPPPRTASPTFDWSHRHCLTFFHTHSLLLSLHAPLAPSCHPTTQGTKYIVDGILFKFSFPADDSPYLGSYECANKAAGHDLRGSISIFHAIEDENNDNEAEEDVNLNCNLMAIIDCLGERQPLLQW